MMNVMKATCLLEHQFTTRPIVVLQRVARLYFINNHSFVNHPATTVTSRHKRLVHIPDTA